MSLYQTVEPSLLKLKRRLTKEGIRGLSHMDYEKYLRTVFWKERIGSRKNRVIKCYNDTWSYPYFSLREEKGSGVEMLIAHS